MKLNPFEITGFLSECNFCGEICANFHVLIQNTLIEMKYLLFITRKYFISWNKEITFKRASVKMLISQNGKKVKDKEELFQLRKSQTDNSKVK